jgi:hypothetical protein
MPKKKTAKNAGTTPKPKPRKLSKPAEKSRKKADPVSSGAPALKTALKPVFENKAGRYELIRVDGDQAHYSFTNRQKRTVDATMPVVMWLRMQARADHSRKEQD